MIKWFTNHIEVIIGTITGLLLEPDTIQVLQSEYSELSAQVPSINWEILLNEKIPSLIYVVLSVAVSYSVKYGFQYLVPGKKQKPQDKQKGGSSDQS